MKNNRLSCILKRVRCLTVVHLVAFCGWAVHVQAQVLTPIDKPQRLTDSQKKELRAWNSRFISSGGVILNAPPSHLSNKPMLNMTGVISQVVQNLAGDRLRAENKQLVLHIYSAPQMNAFVSRVVWPPKKLELSSPSVLTLLYPGIDLRKPVYEVGITLGLLNRLNTVDELSFVLGHELSHLFEGHVDGLNLPIDENGKQKMPHDPDTRNRLFKHWWSSQQHESVVDYLSIQMMLGKYNLEAVPRALNVIFPPTERTNDNAVGEALSHITSTHHSEGLRLSMAQSNIKYLNRTSPLAVPRDESSLLDVSKVKYRAPKKIDIEVATENETMDEAKTLWEKVISQKIAILASADEIVPMELHQEKFPLEKDHDLILVVRAISFVKDKIEQSDLSVQEKGNAYWDLFRFYESEANLLFAKMHNDNAINESVDRSHWIQTQSIRKALVLPILKSLKQGWSAQDLFEHMISAIRKRSLEHGADQVTISKSIWWEFYSICERNKILAMDSIASTSIGKQFLYGLLDKFVFADGHFNLDVFLSIASTSGFRKASDVFKLSAFGKTIGDYVDQYLVRNEYRELLKEYFINNPSAFVAVLRKLSLSRKNNYIRTQFVAWVHSWVREFRPKIISTIIEQASLNKRIDFHQVEFVTSSMKQIPFNREESLAFTKALVVIADQSLKIDYNTDISFGIDKDKQFKRVTSGALSFLERVNILTFFAAINNAPDLKNSIVNSEAATQVKMALSGLTAQMFVQNVLTTPVGLLNAEKQLQSSDKFKDSMRAIETLRKQNPQKTSNEIQELFYAKGEAWDRYAKLRGDLVSLSIARIDIIKGWLIYWNVFNASKVTQIQLPTNIVEQVVLKLVQEEKRRYEISVLAEMGLDEVAYLKIRLSTEAASGLLRLFSAVSPRYKDLNRWVHLLGEIYTRNPTVFDSNPEIKQQLQREFFKMSKANSHYAYQLLREKSLQALLSANEILPIIVEEFQRRLNGSKNTNIIAKILSDIDSENLLQQSDPQIFDDLREQIATLTRTQPSQLQKIFPEDDFKINTKSTSQFASHVRGLSAFSALGQNAPVAELIELIEYLMSRSEKIPQFIYKVEADAGEPITDLLRGARITLSRQDQMSKIFTINSLLAGPNSPLERIEGRNAFVDHLFKDISSKNKTIAIELFESLLYSQGNFKSMPVAYILAQTAKDGKKLSEGEIIKASFEAFGAAGIKLGQYLAFTGEFKEFQESLSQLQDSAMPLSYLQAVRLLQSRYGDAWNRQHQVLRVLGTGSVNIAVEIFNKTTQKIEVISVLRADIETSSKDDFRMLKKFIFEFISRDPYHSKKYDYLLGLLDVIQDSVTLEFNKKNAYDRQAEAVGLYRFKSGPWQFQSVQPYSLDAGAVRMEKAPGQTARHWRDVHPKIYKDVMSRFLRWELDLLLGTHPSLRQFELMANPDIHDGQILIDSKDLKSGLVTVLDFGQALPITDKERQLAFDIVILLETVHNEKDLQKQLARLQKNLNSGSVLSNDELQQFLQREERMDRFVYLLGVLKKHDWKIPMSSVHWILGLNRADKLGKNVGININWALKTTLMGNRMGLPIDSVNAFRMSLSRILGNENRFLPVDQKQTVNNFRVLSCSKIYLN